MSMDKDVNNIKVINLVVSNGSIPKFPFTMVHSRLALNIINLNNYIIENIRGYTCVKTLLEDITEEELSINYAQLYHAISNSMITAKGNFESIS